MAKLRSGMFMRANFGVNAGQRGLHALSPFTLR